ncbi:phosphatidylserine decarboxylase proenzyme [Polynucleobacter sp. SHI8]|uniref:phosphatidylserine decarboxylase n=1 Tax=unclassified Polynucleobacter TaxID=2640945 RepID=UPI00249027F8|nr:MULTISPECIES: phosphatidylserine decarboxylase [unclassified Polynucleobacter]BDW10556.1 phosphatidylserine decarboxylase proenzyme [Polynucleobacter sp. SHI2]BDW13002.1 phosphatidylserine decarboxylase proenzyme [Polynucleobacter sp. SHI8]
MSVYKHPIIAREGWPYLIGLGILAIIFTKFIGVYYALPIWILFIFVLQFFRDPPRLVPIAANAILAPADGRIVAVEKTFDPYAKRDALKISIFMNVFNVHSNRIAVNGRIKSIEYFPGKFFNADLDKASVENERNAVVIDANGHDITLVQVAGLIARRILCYAQVGDAVKKGERYGFIRFGSRVDVYMPLDVEPLVSVGDTVYATTTLLAILSHLDS